MKQKDIRVLYEIALQPGNLTNPMYFVSVHRLEKNEL